MPRFLFRQGRFQGSHGVDAEPSHPGAERKQCRIPRRGGISKPIGRAARACQRAINQSGRVVNSIDRHEGARTRSFLLAEEHLVEHVEPLERDPRLAVLGLDLAAPIQKRFAWPTA